MNWLERLRLGTEYENQQLAFSKTVGFSDRTVRRWETHDPDHGNIPFARIAKLLQLAESMVRGAYEESLARHRAASRSNEPLAAEAARTTSHHSAEIRAALLPFDGTSLIADICNALWLDETSLDGAATALARRIEDPREQPGFIAGFYQPCSDAVARAGDVETLCALRRCVEALVRVTVNPISPRQHQEYRLEHKADLFELRVALSRALRRDGLRSLTAKTPTRIDRSWPSLRGSSLEEVTETDPDRRFFEIIRKLSSDLCMKAETPSLDPANGNRRFEAHCHDLVRELAPMVHGHDFPFLRIYSDEDDTVKTRLIDLFQSLPLVISGHRAAERSLFRVSAQELEGCFARLIFDIDFRLPKGQRCHGEPTLQPLTTLEPPTHNTTEEGPMNHNRAHTGVANSGTMHVGKLVIGNDSSLNKTEIVDALDRELQTLMGETRPSHGELRDLIRQLQTSLEAADTKPQPGSGAKLKSLVANLQLTDKAMASAQRVAGYVEQLGILP